MRFGGFLERIGLVDFDLDNTGAHHLEQAPGPRFEILARGGVVGQ